MDQGNWLHFKNVVPSDPDKTNPGTGRTHPTGGAGGCINLGECQPQQDLMQCSGDKNNLQATQGFTLIDISCNNQPPAAAMQSCSGNQSCMISIFLSRKQISMNLVFGK